MILCKRGSASAKMLSELADVPRCYWQGRAGSPLGATHLINWGCFGAPHQKFLAKYPFASTLPVINKLWPGGKYTCIKLVKEAGVPVPISVDDVDQAAWTNTHWIYKPYLSRGGRGIVRIDNNNGHELDWNRGYAQQEVRDRKYEVRVSAFNWLAPEEWGCWKKFCNNQDQLTWNHEQGGVFEKVDEPLNYPLFQRCFKHSAIILKTLGLQFGAIDFIVGPTWNEMFLEINTQPGFTQDYGADVYVKAIERLKDMPVEMINSLIQGERHNEIEELIIPQNEEIVPEPLIDDLLRDQLNAMLRYRSKDEILSILNRL